MTSGESSGLKIKYIHFSKYLYLTLRVRLNEIILKKHFHFREKDVPAPRFESRKHLNKEY